MRKSEKQLRNPTITAAAVAGVAPVQGCASTGDVQRRGHKRKHSGFERRAVQGAAGRSRGSRAAAAKDVQDALRADRARRARGLAERERCFRAAGRDGADGCGGERSLRLAQARYDNALGSIVELNQAQLNQTSAEIAAASAKYEYLNRAGGADYAMGVLR